MLQRNIGKFRAAILGFITMLFAASTCQAHFIWIEKTDDGKIRVYFGEEAGPDQAKFLGGIEQIQAWEVSEKNHRKLNLETSTAADNRELGWLETKSNFDFAPVAATCEYGVFERGEKTMLLHYCTKYIRSTEMTPTSAVTLPLDIVTKSTDEGIQLMATFQDKPVANCEFVIAGADGKAKTINADEKGIVVLKYVDQKQRYLIRASHVVDKKGTYENKNGESTDFDSKNYYCTLVLDVANESQGTDKVSQKAKMDDDKKMKLADLPFGITSFGAAKAGEYLYTFGGHRGTAHEYYDSGQNGKLMRLKIGANTEWETLNESNGLQGLAMVAVDDRIYRLGGFDARNKKGEPQDLHSVNEFAVFDMGNKEWQQLEPMPVARSSFDAVVVGSQIFVVGGWIMAGDQETVWCDTAYSIDLKEEKPAWKEIKKPEFARRAVSLGFQDGKVVVIGGMQQKGGPTTKVAIYDIKSDEWSEGPALAGSPMEGFGSSCFNIGGSLVASTYGGNVYRLSEDRKKWESIATLDEGRFFHRLLPIDEAHCVLIGGADMESGRHTEMELIPVNVGSTEEKK